MSRKLKTTVFSPQRGYSVACEPKADRIRLEIMTVFLPRGSTVRLMPPAARKLGKALLRYAEVIEKRNGT